MKCTCGGSLTPTTTDVPFKLSENRTVIIKDLPVLQCRKCRQFVIEEGTMSKVDVLLANVSSSAKVAIIRFVD